MSHIPNSAMPHAGPTPEAETEKGWSPTLSERAGSLAEKARENPKAVAAGAAVVAGAIAAAAIPMVRARRKNAEAKGRKGGSKKND